MNGDGVRDAGATGMANDTLIGPHVFVAGDVRANEHAALTSMHTVFVREHNRLADWISATQLDLPLDPIARDEEVYQRARKLVGAEIQAITYNQFLPSLGLQLPSYAGYSESIDPSVTNEFATAAYRMGHSQINGTSLRVNSDGTLIAAGPLNLFEGFFDPTTLTDEGGLEPLLRGLAMQVQEATDAKMSDGLRNLLFTGFPGGGPVANGTDLAALNIQRGRDHGLADYNTTRVALGLDAVTQFSDITSDPDLQTQLASIYGSVDAVDLWVGVLAEDHLPGSCVGELTTAILSDQFVRLHDGDRFYFENDTDLAMWLSPDGSDATALDWLRGLTLSDVIQANTAVAGLRANVFVVPEPMALTLYLIGAAAFSLHVRRRQRSVEDEFSRFCKSSRQAPSFI